MAQVDFSHATLELLNPNNYGFLSEYLGFLESGSGGACVYAINAGGEDVMVDLPLTLKTIESHPDKVVYNYTGSFRLNEGSYRYKDRMVIGGTWGYSRYWSYLIKNISFETGDTFCFDVVITVTT